MTQFGIRSTFRSEAAQRIEAAGRAFSQSPAALAEKAAAARRTTVAIVATPGPCRRIIDAVAAETGVPVAEILSNSRRRDIVLARHDAIWRCLAETQLSLVVVGRIFGRDHTSIGSAIMSRARRTGEAPPRGLDWNCADRGERRRARATTPPVLRTERSGR